VRIVSVRICILALCLPFSSTAGLVRFEVTERSPVLQGKAFGAAGPYERIAGRVYFAVAPDAPANQLITNLKRAPRNDHAEVTFFADFYVISPVDPRKGNGTLLFEVGNRGRKSLLTVFSRAKSSFDPRTEAEFGDGLLLKEGFTLAWVGWQFDVPREPPLMSVTVPVARDPAGPIIGLVRSDFVPDEKIHSFSLGDRAFLQYPVIDRSDPSATLTERDRSDGTPRLIPRNQWQFAREKDGSPVPDSKNVYLSTGFEPGKIYEVVYRSQDPPVVGLGMAAVRDFVSYFKNGAKGAEAGPLDSVRSSVKRTLGFGSSQSGRFLRTFLYFGLNQDERGLRVFDGVWAHVAGGGRGSFNFQFAQPSRDARPFFNFHYPTDIFPFTEADQTDPESGISDGLLKRTIGSGGPPKIFYTNTSYEYYGRAASLSHTSIDGSQDVPLTKDSRLYVYAGGNHGSGSIPPTHSGTQYLENANDYEWFMRSLLIAMQKWIAEDHAPPPSIFPKIGKGELVLAKNVAFPAIPGVTYPARIHRVFRMDFGETFRTAGVITKEPPEMGKEFPTLVMQVNKDGNEIAGLKTPQVAVPLATHTGWNLRDPLIGAPSEMYSMKGSYFPFARTKSERERRGDPRLSVAERYAGPEEYVKRIGDSARKLFQQGYLLERDLPAILQLSRAEWDYVMTNGSGSQ
jgi:alpha/beta hydrolase family protein